MNRKQNRAERSLPPKWTTLNIANLRLLSHGSKWKRIKRSCLLTYSKFGYGWNEKQKEAPMFYARYVDCLTPLHTSSAVFVTEINQWPYVVQHIQQWIISSSLVGLILQVSPRSKQLCEPVSWGMLNAQAQLLAWDTLRRFIKITIWWNFPSFSLLHTCSSCTQIYQRCRIYFILQ